MSHDYDYDINKVCPPIWDDLSAEYRAECEKYQRENIERDQRKEFDGIKNHIWTKGVKLNPGVYTEQFKGNSANITRCLNTFHKALKKNYNGQGQILDTSTVQLANGTCMYLTFELF